MSMWLSLAKITPELLAAVRTQPDLLRNIFPAAAETVEPLAGFDPRSDALGTDYRTLSAVAEGIAEAMGEPEEFEEQDTWLSKAVHGVDGDALDYEFTYSTAFAFDPGQVAQIAAGLADDGDVSEDEDEDVGRFYVAAAKQGKAIIGGIG